MYTLYAQVYPASARLMALLSILEMRAHTVSRLRRDMRALCDDSPSPQAWLMAARTEAHLAGSAHRVQVDSLLETGMGERSILILRVVQTSSLTCSLCCI